MAHISSIVIQPDSRTYGEDLSEFIREPVQQANLIANYGLEGDAKAGHHPRRQVNFLTDDWLAAREAEGYRAEPGNFGEQLILSGVVWESLEAGDHVQLGSEAVLEISGGRTGCSRLEAAQGKTLDPSFQPAIGMLARVIQDGAIQVGDPVVIRKSEMA
jgi:MOSC domain-containing protein YiiM